MGAHYTPEHVIHGKIQYIGVMSSWCIASFIIIKCPSLCLVTIFNLEIYFVCFKYGYTNFSLNATCFEYHISPLHYVCLCSWGVSLEGSDGQFILCFLVVLCLHYFFSLVFLSIILVWWYFTIFPLFFFFFNMFIDFRERGRVCRGGRERERKRNICWLPPIRTPTWDRIPSLLVYGTTLQPT